MKFREISRKSAHFRMIFAFSQTQKTAFSFHTYFLLGIFLLILYFFTISVFARTHKKLQVIGPHGPIRGLRKKREGKVPKEFVLEFLPPQKQRRVYWLI
jgi:hypothetical protein